jgi:hypothetical protein
MHHRRLGKRHILFIFKWLHSISFSHRAMGMAFALKKSWRSVYLRASRVVPRSRQAVLRERECSMDSKIERLGKWKAAFLSAATGVAFLGVGPQTAVASLITGAVSFFGNVTPFPNTSGTGTPVTDFTLAKSLSFGASFAAAGPTNSFSSLPASAPVTVSLIDVNPTASPAPSAPLWTVGGFTFTLTSPLTEPTDTSDVLVLKGTGTISDGTPADSNTGTWVATFTTSGSTYSWNSSFTTAAVPEPASIGALAVAGAGLLARRKR